MLRFSANINLLYNELPFEDRFAEAGNHFSAVEIQFPYEWPAGKTRNSADAANTEIVLYNMPAGNLRAGETGIAALPGREEEFCDAVHSANSYHKIISAKCINFSWQTTSRYSKRNCSRCVYSERTICTGSF